MFSYQVHNWVSSTSKAIWAARLSRLEDTFSDTSSVSSLAAGLLASIPIAFTASAAGKHTQPHYHREYAKNLGYTLPDMPLTYMQHTTNA